MREKRREAARLLGMTGGQLFYVAYTERGPNIRIISARRATRHEYHIHSLQMPLPDVLNMEAQHQAIAARTQDRAEGAAAFQEKRAPQFQGR